MSLKIFAPAIVFTIIMFGTLTWYAWYSYRHLMVVETQHFKAAELVGRITHLDEVLTMSARMAAATGDPQWEQRYGEYEPQLDAAIKDVTELAPEALMSKAAAQTDAANVRLVEMERKAFGLVREEDRQAAMATLHSAEYAEQKRIYSEGMKAFTEGLQAHTHAELRRHRRQILVAASFAAVSASLVLFVWVGMLQKLKYGSERRSSEKALRRSESQFKERIEREGRVVGLESAWVKRDGTTLFVIENCRAIRDEHGNTLYYEGTAEDITERRKGEETLRKSEGKYRTLAANIPGMIFRAKSDWSVDFVSNTESLCGYSPQEFYEQRVNWLDIVHPEDKEKVLSEGERLAHKAGSFVQEYRIVTKRGDTRWVEDHKTSSFGEGDDPLVIDGIVFDITERRRIQDAHGESEANLAMAQEVARIGSWEWNFETGKVVWSDEAYRMLGFEPGEIEPHLEAFLDFVHPDDKELVRKAVEEAAEEGTPGRIEFRVIRKDGAERVFEGKAELVQGKNGRPVKIIGICQDITDRKTAEEEVKKFKTIAERADYGNAISDLDGNLVHVNESFAKMHGYRIDELQGKNLSLLHTKEQLERSNRLLDQLVREGSFVGEEVWHKRKDDTIFPALMNGTLVRDENGRPLFMAVTAIDITETKQAEAALRQSEQRYKTLVENLPQRVFLKDLNSIYVSCNENLARDLGISPEEVPGKSDYDLFSRELAEKYMADDKRVMESGEIHDIEEQVVFQGQEMTVHTVKTSVRDEEGNVTGVLGIFWDITAQKRLELALRESEEKYRTLVESAGETIVTIDRDGKYLFMNRTGAKRAGRKVEDYIGKTMWDMFPKHIADRQMNTVREVIDSGEGVNLTVQTELQGQVRWYNTTVEPLRDSSGAVTAALVVARDINEIRQAEMELEAYGEKMTRAERLASLGTLSATLAHELTQPLTVISLSIEDSLADLEGITCPTSVKEGLRDSLSEVSNVAAIVERFRNFARKSSGKVFEKVELGVVGERIVKLLKKSAQQARIAVHLKGMDKLPVVYLNEKEVEQLFFALIQNAIHEADGKKPRNLVIEGAVKSEYIELRFSDDCGGIEQADVDKVFEPFFTTKPAGEGTGLGLCIVQRVAERSGGSVRVENRPGEGVTFIVSLGVGEDRMS